MRFLLVVLMSFFMAVGAQAQSTPPAQGSGSTGVLGDLADIVFKEAEKRVIEEYYDRVPGAKKPDDEDDDARKKSAKKDKGKKDKDHKNKDKGRGNGLPPGLAKRAQLPPGLAKRGNQLPPGLMKGDLPTDLESKLGDLPKNVERVIVDDDVLLVQKGTDLILDVLEGVIRGQ